MIFEHGEYIDGGNIQIHAQGYRAEVESNPLLPLPDDQAVVRAVSAHPDVVSAGHGWWQGCDELGLPGYDALGNDGANFNLLISDATADPISGSVPHRSYVCEVRALDAACPTSPG